MTGSGFRRSVAVALAGVVAALLAVGTVWAAPTTRLASVSSSEAHGDGRFVVFSSDATNLVADDTNGVNDVFVRGPLR